MHMTSNIYIYKKDKGQFVKFMDLQRLTGFGFNLVCGQTTQMETNTRVRHQRQKSFLQGKVTNHIINMSKMAITEWQMAPSSN